jgi:hypothetical protein
VRKTAATRDDLSMISPTFRASIGGADTAAFESFESRKTSGHRLEPEPETVLLDAEKAPPILTEVLVLVREVGFTQMHDLYAQHLRKRKSRPVRGEAEVRDLLRLCMNEKASGKPERYIRSSEPKGRYDRTRPDLRAQVTFNGPIAAHSFECVGDVRFEEKWLMLARTVQAETTNDVGFVLCVGKYVRLRTDRGA